MTTSRAHLIVTLLGGTFVLGIVTQRLGVWAGGYPFAANLLPIILLPALLWAVGAAQLLRSRLLAYLTLVLVTTASTLANIRDFSLNSFLLLLASYLPFCFGVVLPEPTFAKLQRVFALTAISFGLLGLLQYLSQFALSQRSRLFTWAWFVPSNFLIEYASLNRLGYLSPIFKSNGFFFLEASALSQLLARVILIGRYYRLHWALTGFGLLGMIATYSGSGLALLAIFIIPLILIEAARGSSISSMRVLPFLAAAGVVVLAAILLARSGVFHAEAITGRVGEFTRPGTSGYARYGSSLAVIRTAFEGRGTLAWLLGVGAGRASQAGDAVHALTTAWVKMLIEYGALGLVSYVGFLAVCLWTSSRSVFVVALLLFSFLFLDGNVLVPQYVFFLLMLGSLPVRAHAVKEDACRARLGDPTARPADVEDVL